MGELVAGIAHHLNNPVGALASTLRRLTTAAANVPEAARGELEPLLARAERITRRIESSVAAIVEASRATARRQPRSPNMITGELPPELAAALATFQAQLEVLPTKDSP
jgi:signal transduction histidine kinase